MRNQGIGSWAARRARMSPHRVAVIGDEREFTYADVFQRATRLAHELAAHGVGYGDRVAYLGPNHPTFLETLFATGMLGGVFVPLNTRLARPELEYMLRDCGARALVWADRHADVVEELRAGVPLAYDLSLADYERVIAEGPVADPLDEAVDDDETCLLMYTSGTTGRPKGVMLSHANVVWNTVNLLIDVDVTQRRGDAGQRADVPCGRAEPDRHAHLRQGGHAGPGAGVRPGADAGAHRAPPGHLPLRRPDDVPGDGPVAAVGRRRPVLGPLGDLRRRAGAGGAHRDLPAARGHVHAGVRPDGVLAGGHLPAGGREPVEGRLGRHGRLLHRCAPGGSGRVRCAAGPAGRGAHPGPERDEGLLGPARRHGRHRLPGRVAAQR